MKTTHPVLVLMLAALVSLAAFSASAANVALTSAGATATASSGGTPANVLDNNGSTAWTSNANNAEWLRVQFNQLYTINVVQLQWGTGWGLGYDILVSQDGATWSTVYQARGHIGGGTHTISFEPVTCRYVMVQGVQRGTTGGYVINTLNAYEGTTLVNVAKGKPCDTSNFWDFNFNWGTLTDGYTYGGWTADDNENTTVLVDLGGIYNLRLINIRWGEPYAKAYSVQVGTANQVWTTIYSTADELPSEKKIEVSASGIKYLRIITTQRSDNYGGLMIREIEAYEGYTPVRPTAVAGNLTTTALSFEKIRLDWSNPPAGAAKIRLLRDGNLLDDFAVSAGSTYTAYQLWRNTNYTFDLEFFDNIGNPLAVWRKSQTTLATGLAPRYFADNSFINTRISATRSEQISANSAAVIAYSFADPAVNNGSGFLINGWGFMPSFSNPVSKQYSIPFTGPYNHPTEFETFRIPRHAKVGGGGDHHFAVVEGETFRELDTWFTRLDGEADSFTPESRYISPDIRTAQGWEHEGYLESENSGARASGWTYFVGTVRPEEIEEGIIRHGVNGSNPRTKYHAYSLPAHGGDGQDQNPGAVQVGAQIQLDPALVVDATPYAKWKKICMRAMQEYGWYCSDTGGLQIVAESSATRFYNAWAGLGPSIGAGSKLNDIPWNLCRLLDSPIIQNP